MLTLIMLCGQRSSGKSTFAQCIVNKFGSNNIEVCSMDNVLKRTKNFDDYDMLISDVQNAINNPKNNCIIIDYAFTNPEDRKKVLSQLILPSSVNFIIITMRPSIKTIVKRQEKRQFPTPLTPEEIISMVEWYYLYTTFPTQEEFSYINFDNISIFTIDIDELKED